MPDSSNVITEIKISELEPAAQANATDQLEANQAGTTRRITIDQVTTHVATSGQVSDVIDDAIAAIPAQPNVVYATEFGATFDGVTDDTLALQAFLDAIPEYGVGIMPAGIAIFTATLTVGGNDKSLWGAGAHTTVLKYAGAATNIDLLLIEHPTNWETAVKRWDIRNFRITSNTDMTAGAALHIHNMTNSVMFGVIIDGHQGSIRGGDPLKSKLWNGVWFDCISTMHVYSMTAKALNDAIICNGGLDGTNGGKGAPMFVNLRVVHSTVGMRIGGAVGGLSTIGANFAHNVINCRIDNTITNETNREVFFGSNTWFDTNYDVSIEIADTLSSGNMMVLFDNGWIGGNQLIGRGIGLYVAPGVGATILINGGRIWLNRNSGIKNDSLTAIIMVSDVQIYNNGIGVVGTYGFENVSGNTTCSIRNCLFHSNGSPTTNAFNNISHTSEFGSQNELRFRERIRAMGPNQATNSLDTAGSLGGSILLQDTGTAVSSGGAAIFGNSAGFWGAVRGQAISNTDNTVGHVVVSTRRLAADATLTETARFRSDGNLVIRQAAVVGAGAATQSFIKASATADLGIYYGTGDPTFSAAKGSLYTRTNATTTTTRLWVNTDGATAWTNLTTAA